MRHFKLTISQSVNIAGIVGLYLFAAGSFIGVTMADLGMTLMFLAYVISLVLYPRYLKDTLFIVSLLFCVYLVFQLVISTHRDPGTFALQFEQASHLARLGFFTILTPAFWLARHKRRYYTILLLVLLSFLGRVLIKFEVGDIEHYLNGERAFLDMSPNSLGLYGAMAVLGTLVYAQRFLGRIHLSWKSFLRIGVWCLVLMFAVAIFIFAQSRAVWVAATLIFVPILLAQLIYNYKHKINKNSQIAILLAVIVVPVAIWLWSPSKNIISERVIFETETLAKIVKGNTSDLKMDAYGLRINWWRLGLEKWREKPLIGWGPYSVEPIMDDYHQKTGKPMGHFHNFYLQVLIQIGLIGFFFFILQYLLLFRMAWKSYRNRWLDFETILFLLGLFGLFAIASLSGLPSNDHFGRNYIALMGGIAYAFRFSDRYPDSSATSRMV